MPPSFEPSHGAYQASQDRLAQLKGTANVFINIISNLPPAPQTAALPEKFAGIKQGVVFTPAESMEVAAHDPNQVEPTLLTDLIYSANINE